MAGEASAVTIDHIWRHPRGGPRVAFTVLRAVCGNAFDDFITRELTEIADARRRMQETDRNAKALWARALAGGSPADRGAGLPGQDRGDEGRCDRRRTRSALPSDSLSD